MPRKVGSFDTGYDSQGLAVGGDYLFVAAGQDGLQVIQIRDPTHPERVGELGADGPQDVALVDGYAYLAAGRSGLRVLDVHDPANVRNVGGVETHGSVLGLVAAGNYAYLAAGTAGLEVVDIRNPPTRGT